MLRLLANHLITTNTGVAEGVENHQNSAPTILSASICLLVSEIFTEPWLIIKITSNTSLIIVQIESILQQITFSTCEISSALVTYLFKKSLEDFLAYTTQSCKYIRDMCMHLQAAHTWETDPCPIYSQDIFMSDYFLN